jgi:rare lipoprotein A
VISHARLHTLISLLVALACLAAAPAALASGGSGGSGGGSTGGGGGSAGGGGGGSGSGGTGLPGGGSGSSSTSPGAALTVPADATVSASGGGLTLTTEADGQTASGLKLSGAARGTGRGRVVAIQRAIGPAPYVTWRTVATATTTRRGRFVTVWRDPTTGVISLRAVLAARRVVSRSGSGGGASLTALRSSGSATDPVTVTIYSSAIATWYGPGLFGRHTACGERLTPSTLGVANRTLPCGTRVSILYDGRSITVPVIDRGPYVGGVSWDLTEATARALDMGGRATIGTLAAG